MDMEDVMKSEVEKLKKALMFAVENFGGKASAWFDGVFPPETRSDKINQWLHLALPYLIAAVVIRVCYGCFRRGGDRGRVKMMKAPGRNDRIPRSQFASDPKGYFRNLRSR